MPSPTNQIWPIELAQEARGLYEAGKHSARQIGAIIGKSRNSVIGYAKRHKWFNPNPQRGGTKSGDRKKRANGVRYSASKMVAALNRVDPGEASLPKQIMPPEFLGLTLATLPSNACHYIPGNDRLYCGQPTDGESQYCGWCRKIMYQPMQLRHGRLTLVSANQ